MPVESWEAWCSHLCLNTKKLHMDANLSEAGVSAGTLSQQMRCQFTDLREALNRSQVKDVWSVHNLPLCKSIATC